ncbi:cytochrome oxidase Cu insertion factor (SCO1/SenC/PrrC family) [Chitinophaga polysaccharea]|uniref:Cytochrome oxidase Cu insertion factor (SCO1/SenC/PrrC family) n=1 Tax=Chitinophaga polysaccharea TaxID=1293035 RepID=A0A561PH24_9BACT|nr:cytochrome oxidase Cu insertion factor (SCO1/SenC/PrrC family) [Chitinophaga polysaccharea]
MRYVFFAILSCLPVFLKAQTATPPTKPAYLQYPIIPAFPLTLVDGHTITKNDLRKGEKTMLFIFSVDCDHCKHLTEDLLKNIDKFQKTQILMVTPFKVEQMKEYYDQYKIKNYPTITMASEPTRQIMYFYDLHYFPGLYIYNKKQQFVKGFEGTAKIDSLLYYLHK